MRKLFAFLLLDLFVIVALCILSLPAIAQQTTTPNISLQVPYYGQTNWQVPIDYDLNSLDTLIGGVGTFPANSTAPSVAGFPNWVTANTSATAITNFLGGYPGDFIRILCADTFTTIGSDSTISLASPFSCTASTGIALVLNGTVWTEVGRGGGGSGSGTFYQTLENNGSILTQRPAFNLIAGTNVSIPCVDNAVSQRTDCTFNAITGGTPSWSSVLGGSTNTNTGFVLSPTATSIVPWTHTCPAGMTVDCYDLFLNTTKEFWIDLNGQAHFNVSPAGIAFPVTTVFGRTGAIVAAANDYAFSQISGSVACAQEPALTGDASSGAGSCSTTVSSLKGLSLPTLAASTGFFFDNNGVLSLSSSASNLNSGTLPHAQLPALLSGDIPNNAANTSGNAATATAISTTGANGTFWGVAGGVQQWLTPGGAGNVSNSGTPTNGQLAEWINATTIQGVTTLPTAAEPAHTGDATNSAGSLAMTVGALRNIALPTLAAQTGLFYDNAGVLSLTTSASVLTSGTLPHAQLPTLVSGDIPNNAANTLGTAANLAGCTPVTAGTVCVWNGSAWTLLAGNNTGTQFLLETSAGVASWGTPSGSGNVNGPGTSTANDLAAFNNTTGSLLLDTGILYTNLVTSASNFTSGDLVQAAGNNKTASDSGIATANLVTQTSNALANQICAYTAANKVCVPTTTLPTAAEPAHTGDVTNTVGSLAMTVVQIEGGTIPVSAVVLGTNASKQPIAATVTGTGSTIVLANSPSLVTANLGTPSAINLSNATALPCGALPAFTGDATTSAGSCAVTVSSLRGISLPTLALSTGFLYDNNGVLALTTSASNLTSGTLPHAQLPALLSGDIPNNAANTSGTAANLSGTPALPNGTTATTQTAGDNTTKIATDAFVLANAVSNPLTTLGDVPYGGASGVLTRLAGPTGPNGVPQILCDIPSSGAATAEQWCLQGVPINGQTGTTYTILSTDRTNYVSFKNSSSVAVAIPQAGTTGFTQNFSFTTCDIGAGTATLTPTTSTISYSNGSAYTSAATSMPLSTGQCAWIYSDNSNYFAIVHAAGTVGGSGTTGHIVQFTASATVGDTPFAIATNEIQPVTDAVSDLGDATHEFRDLYLSGVLHMGGSGPAALEGPTGTCTVAGTGNGKLCFSSTGNRPVFSYSGGSNTNIILGTDIPISAHVLGSNGSGQPIAALATDLSAIQYAAGGGTGDVQTLTLAPAAVSLTAGLVVRWLPTAANATTTPTLNVNGLGTKTITKLGTGALAANDLTATAVAVAIYDGTEFQLQNPQTASGGGGGGGALSSITALTANTTLDNAAFTYEWDFSNTSTSSFTLGQDTAAISGTNHSGPIAATCGTYWNGSASANDCWTWQDVVSAGTNPNTSLTLVHSGSSGASLYAVKMTQVGLWFAIGSNSLIEGSNSGQAINILGGQSASNPAGTVGLLTVQGGDITGGSSASNVAGSMLLRGGNNAGTSTSSKAGGAEIGPGLSTGATAGEQGVYAQFFSYVKGTTSTLWNVECFTAAMTAGDCGASPGNWIGIAEVVGTNTTKVIASGQSPVNSSNTATVGDTFCAGATAGEGTDSGGTTACALGSQIGIVAAVSGTYVYPDGVSVTLSTTLPLIQIARD